MQWEEVFKQFSGVNYFKVQTISKQIVQEVIENLVYEI